MVGDLIICPDVTLWQVISIADSGEVTARFLVNFKGEQGIQGQKGDNGKDALVYNGRVGIPYSPTVNTGVSVSLNFSDFNYNPVIGDIFIANLYNFATTPAENYIACLKVDGVGGTKVTGVFPTALAPITAQAGELLYKHTIIFRQGVNTKILMELYTRSSAPMSYDDIASYLYHKETRASGIHNAVDFTQTTPKDYVYSVYAHDGVILVNHLSEISGGVQNSISKADVTTTDTVEEI